MVGRQVSVKTFLKITGIVSPYLAVILGLFILKSAFFAVLFYHLMLVICIIGINRSKTLTLLRLGFHRYLGPLISLGGLLPGIVIFLLWPFAKRNASDLTQLMELINLENTSFTIFALYSCLINPFLEESFWRGCFKTNSWFPNYIDMLFAGYHTIVLAPVVKPVFVLFSFMALMIVGCIFRNIYRLTGGLSIPLLTHIVADIAILYAVWKIMSI